MSDVVLVADGGEITVGRRVAGFVWGKWVTQVLDGEQPKADDPRLVQGFVHKPMNMPQGRFDIRGVRADITQVMAVAPDGGIDYDRGSSDAEQVLDAAETRSDGEVFFESDITAIGLGPHVPGLDFDIDSIVDVQLCQRRIAAPVTAVDMIAENGVLGWRVHTGGQPIVDSVRLNSSNTQILGALVQERRESDARLAAVDSKADGAVSDARAAQSTATQADENAKAAQGSAYQAQETADDAIKKWREQKDALDKVQSAQIETNAKVNDAQQHAIEANSTALTLAPRFLHIDDGKPGFYGSSSGKLSTGAEFGSLEFRGTTFTKNSGAAFVSKAGWQGSILMICVATNGATDITATEITQAGQVHEMHAGGSFQAYRSATVVVLPVFSERKG